MSPNASAPSSTDRRGSSAESADKHAPPQARSVRSAAERERPHGSSAATNAADGERATEPSPEATEATEATDSAERATEATERATERSERATEPGVQAPEPPQAGDAQAAPGRPPPRVLAHAPEGTSMTEPMPGPADTYKAVAGNPSQPVEAFPPRR